MAALCVVLSGCEARFTTPPEPGSGEGVRPLCGEIGAELSVEPVVQQVGAGQLFVFTALGGTGAYRWSLSENVSGAQIDPNAGVYVAGMVNDDGSDTVDVVRLEDRGCRGEATASVTVVEAPAIVPQRVVLGRGDEITFTGTGGSGMYLFALAGDRSGATVTTTGTYTAGTVTGRDVVRLTDMVLGATADAVIDVVDDPSLRVTPSDWAIPVGTEVALPVVGGSGEFDVTIAGAGLEHVSGTSVRATGAGSATVTFADRYLASRRVDVHVTALAPADAPRRHDGDASFVNVVGGTGDFDGDGFSDVVVGMAQSDGEYFGSGRVLIYRGTASGLDPMPARVFSGISRGEELGMAVTVADLDGDGTDDLLIGSRRADPTLSDIGAVYVYRGEAGRFFSEEPIREFYGVNSFDLFGDALAVCDFNGDGRPDLAVGSPFGQDPDGASDQGTVAVFLSYPNGRFLSTPDVRLLGEVLTPGMGFGALERMRLGEAIAAGDFDGDGVCDLAVSAIQAQADVADTGAVYLYLSRAANGPDRGGPALTPSIVWARADATDDDNRFGDDIAMGDVDGDGKADIVAGRYAFDGTDGNDTGALYVMLGHAVSGEATAITDIDAGADWSIEGLAGDRLGESLAVYDVDGDGDQDVLIGAARAQYTDSMMMTTRPGGVRIHHGGNGPLSATPDRDVMGPMADDWFGLGIGAVADLDGDGRAEVLAFAPFHDSEPMRGDDVGALYLRTSGGQTTELDLLIEPSGQQIGRDVAWLGDLDGDGNPELAVGNQGTDVDVRGRNMGSVRIYRGTASGVAAAPIQELGQYAINGGGDEFGVVVRSAGDFDGDGRTDLAVLARSEDSPSMPRAEWTEGCGSRTDPGTVFVFRGNGDGTFADEPSFLYFGPYAGQRVETLDAGFDVNGDGLDDIVVGSLEWDPAGMTNAGGVAVVYGRAAPTAGMVDVICAADWQRDGTVAGERLGFSVAFLGDVDMDGCADFAAGTPEADPLTRNEGGAIVVLGWDATNCGANTSPREVRLTGSDRDSQAGRAVGGGDLTGDGRGDLVIGADQFRSGEGLVGRVYFVDGSYIAANAGNTIPVLQVGSMARLTVDGASAGDRLGVSIAVARDPAGGRMALLGAPFGAYNGIVNSGGAVAYAVSAMGFAAAPRLIIAGEALGEGNLGWGVAAFSPNAMRTVISVGAPWSSMIEHDDGASYAFSLDR
ncbi:MAG: FG-GAP-like repeat-containing protein [Sandaracinaceae bacterium]